MVLPVVQPLHLEGHLVQQQRVKPNKKMTSKAKSSYNITLYRSANYGLKTWILQIFMFIGTQAFVKRMKKDSQP